jgi:hypothetical protein
MLYQNKTLQYSHQQHYLLFQLESHNATILLSAVVVAVAVVVHLAPATVVVLVVAVVFDKELVIH